MLTLLLLTREFLDLLAYLHGIYGSELHAHTYHEIALYLQSLKKRMHSSNELHVLIAMNPLYVIDTCRKCRTARFKDG